jgi:hypothetical protein
LKENVLKETFYTKEHTFENIQEALKEGKKN